LYHIHGPTQQEKYYKWVRKESGRRKEEAFGIVTQEKKFVNVVAHYKWVRNANRGLKAGGIQNSNTEEEECKYRPALQIV
jgi:hypothetical protein